jgi:hypothetical protein
VKPVGCFACPAQADVDDLPTVQGWEVRRQTEPVYRQDIHGQPSMIWAPYCFACPACTTLIAAGRAGQLARQLPEGQRLDVGVVLALICALSPPQSLADFITEQNACD